MVKSGRFRFDGGAGTLVGTAILGSLLTQWRWEHTDFAPALAGDAVAATAP